MTTDGTSSGDHTPDQVAAVVQSKRPYTRHTSNPATEDEAKARFAETSTNDPFPSISPSLLNSADIHDYACQTGMVFPYESERLKSASYAVRIGTRVIYWKDDGTLQDITLKDGEEFILESNSILFLTTEEFFRLPAYLAIRFNLHIEYVHKGLLLGTGPLVDPGFEGRLLIPLHNLTNNKYTLRQGEEIIWVEFTKITANPLWANTTNDYRNAYNLLGEYRRFKDDKKDKGVWHYLQAAMRRYKDGPVETKSIQNSIPPAIKKLASDAEKSSNAAIESQKNAEQSSKTSKEIWDRVTMYSAITLFGVAIATIALYMQMSSTITNADRLAGLTERDMAVQSQTFRVKLARVENTERNDRRSEDNEIKSLGEKIDELKKDLLKSKTEYKIQPTDAKTKR